MRFFKYHALGNDYLVLEGGRLPEARLVQRICDRRRGIGSDGVLLEVPAPVGMFGFRVINPDGSEAEVSGNGARIFARHLFNQARVAMGPFGLVSSAGRSLTAQVIPPAQVQVAMGEARIGPLETPLGSGYPPGWSFTAVDLGNPHAVVFLPEVDRALVEAWGPRLERDPRFPKRSNVQFAVLRHRQRVDVWIWERGAGFTEASGSSACAVVAAGQALARLASAVVVEMPGGALEVERSPAGDLVQRGPVVAVAAGIVAPEWLAALG